MNSLFHGVALTTNLLVIATWAPWLRAERPLRPADDETQTIADAVEAIRVKQNVPALFVGRFYRDGRQAVVATGLRKVGTETAVTAEDLIHLGSCTKAMTALMIAQLVASEQLGWDTTLGEIFPDVFAANQESDWASVTIEELLWHESGAPANAAWHKLDQQFPNDVRASRRAMLEWLVEQPRPTREKYRYSNVGYALLGHVAESIDNASWEELVDRKLFQPLGIESAGFGPVKGVHELDQPWGHSVSNPLESAVSRVAELLAGHPTRVTYTPKRIDNAAPLGPAGRVHMRLTDWAKFVRLFATNQPPDPSLGVDAVTWRQLLTTSKNGDYAGGWVLAKRDWADGDVLNHAGSNTTWYCVAWVAPNKEFLVLAATNCFSEQAREACDQAVGSMIAAP
jgi:CubicO group peptidase (beta-lactamase class C family)